MKRAARTMLALFLYTALFACGPAVAIVTVAQTQPGGEGGIQPRGEEDGEGEEKDKTDDTFAPRGPDELFIPLPDEGLYEGQVPESTVKAVILRVPNEDSWNLRPEDDLGGDALTITGGFVLMLEQRLDYLPQVHVEVNRTRMHRYAARLRKGDAPRAGSNVAPGDKSQSLESVARVFGADLVFAVSSVPAEGDTPAKGACCRYNVGGGVEGFVEWVIGKPGEPEVDSQSVMLDAKAREITRGILATPGEDGTVVEVPHAPVPRLVTNDKALVEFVKLRDALEFGQLTRGLIAFEKLKGHDPRSGRAALYGMEICRGISDRQVTPEEHATWINRSIEVGRAGLKHAPNDVMLRGRLCWNGATHFNRRAWAREGLKQAMVVQPANMSLFDWWVLAYAYDDKLKQAEWMIEHALPKVSDGRVELSLGNICYGAGDYKKGVEWYTRATEKMPNEHEAFLSLGLCANYEAERHVKRNNPEQARDVYATAAEALWRAMEIDPLELGWAYEYYVRTKTRKFTYLPNADDLPELYLAQAVVNGLSSSSRTFQWDRLTREQNPLVDRTMRVRIRKLVKEAKPGDEHYAMKLMARFKLAAVDDDRDDMIHTLWLMREDGWRPQLYNDAMASLGPLVDEYEPPQGEPAEKDSAKEEPADAE